MKKIFMLLLVSMMIFGMTGCGKVSTDKRISEEYNIGKGTNTAFQNVDAKKFKLEYESLNGVTAEGKTAPYIETSVPEDNPFIYVDYPEVKKMLENGTGILYFGFPECPWCRNLVPTLTDALTENNVKEIYYFNALSIRDKRHLDDKGKVVVDQEGTREYYELIDTLKDVLPVYEGLNDDSIKRLYFPTVLFIKDGEIIGMHQGTLDSQTDPQILLNEIQKSELKDELSSYINKIFSQKCETEKAC